MSSQTLIEHYWHNSVQSSLDCHKLILKQCLTYPGQDRFRWARQANRWKAGWLIQKVKGNIQPFRGNEGMSGTTKGGIDNESGSKHWKVSMRLLIRWLDNTLQLGPAGLGVRLINCGVARSRVENSTTAAGTSRNDCSILQWSGIGLEYNQAFATEIDCWSKKK